MYTFLKNGANLRKCLCFFALFSFLGGAVFSAPLVDSTLPVVVLSFIPKTVSLPLVESLEKVLGSGKVGRRFDIDSPEKLDSYLKELTKINSPQVIVALGTNLSKKLSKVLPPFIKLVSLVSKLTDEEALEGVLSHWKGGVVLGFSLIKILRTLKKLLPTVKNVGIMISDKQNEILDECDYIKLEKELNVKIKLEMVSKQRGIGGRLAELLKTTDAICLIQDPFVLKSGNVRYILGRALRARKPVVGLSASYVRAGALFCIKHDYKDIGRQLGEKVSSVLNDKQTLLSYSKPENGDIIVNSKIVKLLNIIIASDNNETITFIK